VVPMVENNGGEMDNGEKIKQWHKDLEALAPERFDDETRSAHEEPMHAANTANSTGGEVAEAQTTPSTPPIPAVDRPATPNAPGSVPGLQMVSPESRPEGEVNDAGNEDTMGLERPATRTISRTQKDLNTDTIVPDRPDRPIRIRSKPKNFDESGPSTRSTSGNENLY
jgi:hypothetical protein